MRRATNIVFFVAAIGAAMMVYMRGRGTSTPPPPPAAQPGSAPVPSSAAPRLAAPEVPVAPVDAGSVASNRPSHPSEGRFMRLIRALVESDPARAEALARQARALYPDGAEADERDALLVDALINQQKIGAARSETHYYFDHHPNGRFADHLSVMTGVHRPPSRR
jgi:hypothetical protein